jgi:hypothetical protein
MTNREILNRLTGISTQPCPVILRFKKHQDVLYFYRAMRPDYPHKTFPDSRNHFFLLMETLAMMPIAVMIR